MQFQGNYSKNGGRPFGVIAHLDLNTGQFFIQLKWSYISTKRMRFPENTDTTSGLTMLQPELIVRKPEMVQ